MTNLLLSEVKIKYVITSTIGINKPRYIVLPGNTGRFELSFTHDHTKATTYESIQSAQKAIEDINRFTSDDEKTNFGIDEIPPIICSYCVKTIVSISPANMANSNIYGKEVSNPYFTPAIHEYEYVE